MRNPLTDEFDCGCDQRKEIMFLHGGASGMDVAILLGVPLGLLIFLWLRKS